MASVPQGDASRPAKAALHIPDIPSMFLRAGPALLFLNNSPQRAAIIAPPAGRFSSCLNLAAPWLFRASLFGSLNQDFPNLSIR
jgi:hypothetical protein